MVSFIRTLMAKRAIKDSYDTAGHGVVMHDSQ